MKKVNSKHNRNLWWIGIGFILCFGAGYITHYMIINWHSFFVTCPNGNKPDKNGCCEGEIYTDAGGGWMVCCPDGGDNCFPPIK